MWNEANIRQPNIVRYVDDQETSTHLYIIMEFVPHGDLSAWICSKSAMPEYLGVKVASQIIGALDYLHSLGITHRDLKPDNILVAGDVFKLSDFGLSKMITNEETFLKTFCGTLLYLAPEVYPGYQRVRAGLPRRTRTS